MEDAGFIIDKIEDETEKWSQFVWTRYENFLKKCSTPENLLTVSGGSVGGSSLEFREEMSCFYLNVCLVLCPKRGWWNFFVFFLLCFMFCYSMFCYIISFYFISFHFIITPTFPFLTPSPSPSPQPTASSELFSQFPLAISEGALQNQKTVEEFMKMLDGLPRTLGGVQIFAHKK